jgi:hypothetical protein
MQTANPHQAASLYTCHTPTPAVISSSITCYKFVARYGGMGTGLWRGLGGSYVIRTKIETK